MKKIWLMFLVSGFATWTFAQQPAQQRGERKLDRMTKELDLNLEQQAKMKDIFNDKPSREAVKNMTKTERKAHRQATEKKVDAILTPEQITKKNALKAEKRAQRKAQRAQNGKVNHTENKLAKMTKRLDLSPEQKIKIKALLEDKPSRREIADMPKAERKAERKTLDAQINAILTPEQLEKKKAYQAKRRAEIKERRQGRRGQNQSDETREVYSLSSAEISKRAERRAERIAQRVDLTTEQRAAVVSLNEDYVVKAQKITEDKSLNKDTRSKAFQKLDQEHHEAIKGILTSTQISKMNDSFRSKTRKRVRPQ